MKEKLTERKTSVSVNAMLNVLKQCCNIVFPLITYPYVAQTLGATNLGKYSFAESVIQYFLLLSALGIPSYAIREGSRIRNDKKKISQFASELFSINFLAMLLSYLILFLLICFVPQLNEAKVLLLILSVNVFTQTIGRDWINSVYEDYKYISLRYICFQILALILTFIFVKDRDDYIVYTLIMLLANAGGNVLNFIHTQRYVSVRLTVHPNIKSHLKPILFLFCTAVAVSIYVKSDIIMIGFLLTEEDVGIYTLSSKIYTIIKALIIAIITVTIPRLSAALGNRKNDVYDRLLNKLRKILCITAFPCATGLFFLSEQVMLLLGGTPYQSGTASLAILCFALAISVFACFYAQGVLVATRKEKYYFVGTIISAIVNIGGNFILIPWLGINGAAITTVLSETIVLTVCGDYAHKNITLKDDSNIKSVMIGCIGIACCCILTKKILHSTIAIILISIASAVPVYAIVLLLFKNKIAIDFVHSVTKRFRKPKGD